MRVQSHQSGILTRRAGWPVIALAAAALLLFLNAGRAHAAPPSLAVSENPVTIMLGSTTKSVQLSWQLNGTASAQLVVQETGGATIVTKTVTTQSGSTPLTVTYGKSYTATLTDPTKASPPVTLQITTKRPAINPDIGDCIVHLCITSVPFNPHGTFAEFSANTTKAARFEMQASTGAPNASGVFSHVDSAMFNLGYVTHWDSHLLGLTPNTTYHYLLKAVAQDGETVMKTGTFTTLKRRVQVTFSKVTVTDDSDDLSACDCTFWFKVGTQQPKSFGEMQVSTDSSVYPNTTFTVENAPSSLTLYVEGQDNDVDFGQFCTNGTAPSFNGGGSNSCMDWASGQITVHTDQSGFGEEFSESFTMVQIGYLEFHVYGTFAVSYIP